MRVFYYSKQGIRYWLGVISEDTFFHEQTINLITAPAPAQAVRGFIKDVPNQVNRAGITLGQGAQFQAAQYAQNGAYLRGDPNADALGNALRASTFHDLAIPAEDLYSLTPIQKIGSQAVGLTLAFDPVIAFARGPAVVQRFTNGAGDLANAFDGAAGQARWMEDGRVGQEVDTSIELPPVRVDGELPRIAVPETEVAVPDVAFDDGGVNVPDTTVDGANGSRIQFVDLSALADIVPGFYRAGPTQIRFTKSDASPFFSKGGMINSLVTDLQSEAVTADQVGDPLQVAIYNYLPLSIDNRRLVAFNLAKVSDIPIQIVSLEDPAIAARFFDRFDPIGGVGHNIVITPSSGRTAAQMLLRDSLMIQGVQLDH